MAGGLDGDGELGWTIAISAGWLGNHSNAFQSARLHSLFYRVSWRSRPACVYPAPSHPERPCPPLIGISGPVSRIADNLGVNPHPEPGRFPLGPGASVPESALRFTFVASGGPGGQNVNKRATKAELRVAAADLRLPEPTRARLVRLAGRRLVDGDLVFTSEVHRSQGQNRAECLDRLRELVLAALTPPRPRTRTRPSRGSVERRLESKRHASETKRRRRRPGD